jgi:hypothetical protein
VKVAGNVTAYALTTCGIDTGSTEVIVRRLTDGQQRASEPATTTRLVESYTAVDSLVMRADGAVAWIAVNHSIVRHASATEVHKLDHRFLLLDSGSGIDPRSLRLHKSKLTWKHRGATRSASLR